MRHWGRRSAAAATAAALVVAQLVFTAPAAQAADPVNIQLLTINDFHGRINASTVQFAGTVKGLEQADGAAGANTLIVGAGDFIGASEFASAVQQDQPTIDVMNELGLDVSAVGNHEFDMGFADLTDRVIGGPKPAQWDYLGANVYDTATGEPALPEYGTYQVGGVTVGVIGVVTQETPTLVSPSGVASLTFGDPVEAINRVADQLSDGDPSNGEADVLVATLHEGAPDSQVQTPPTPDVTLEQQMLSPVFSDIVTNTSPKVAAIVTGHTHKAYAYQGPVPGQPGATRPIIQTGNYGDNVGQIVLTVDRETMSVTASTVQNVARTATPAATLLADPVLGPLLTPISNTVQAALAYAAVIGNQPIGSLTADITTATTAAPSTSGVCGDTALTRDDRASESTLGNLVANSLLSTLSDEQLGGAEIGVVNPGGLRAELCNAADAKNPADSTGTILYAEANGVLPFVNNLWTIDLTGAQFKTALEQQWQRNADGTVPSRPYLQLGLSDNVTYTYDPTAPEGSRITSVTVNGEPLDPARTYRVGSFSFLLEGGDNFREFTHGTNKKDSGLIDRDAWIAYLTANKPVSPDFARHSVVVTEQPTTAGAGATVAFDVAKLDLTSKGSPANTTLAAVLSPADPASALPDIPLGSFAVAAGAAHVEFALPAQIQAGAWNVVLTAAPTDTTVTFPLTVTATSTVTLTGSATSQVYGSPDRVKLTATVTSSTGTATGSVEFRNGSTVLATVALSKGVATYRLPASTPAGTLSIVAHYIGDGTAPAADSAPLTITVNKASSVTVLWRVPVCFFFAKSAPLLVSIVQQDNGRAASGILQIYDNGALFGFAVVRGGVAWFQVPRAAWTKGTHRYVATFVPDDPYNVSGSSSLPLIIVKR